MSCTSSGATRVIAHLAEKEEISRVVRDSSSDSDFEPTAKRTRGKAVSPVTTEGVRRAEQTLRSSSYFVSLPSSVLEFVEAINRTRRTLALIAGRRF